MIKIALIGVGYWGPNLLRNFSNLPNCQVVTVCDKEAGRLTSLNRQYPAVEFIFDTATVMKDPRIDAVVIATPISTHYDLARQALINGKHVLVEKPLASTVKEAEELCELATRANKMLMVDHTFLYHGAVNKIKQLIFAGDLGDLLYFDSVRINLGLFQQDVNVVWDLAPHDLSMLYYLCPGKPESLLATGISHTKNKIENIAYLTLFYPSDFIAHLSCSWTSPVKFRTILIGGTKKMIVYDDLEPTEKVKVYDAGFDVKSNHEKNSLLIDYRNGDIYVPKIDLTEALKGVAIDFLKSITDAKDPISNCKIGLDVVKVLEAAEFSIRQGGKEVRL